MEQISCYQAIKLLEVHKILSHKIIIDDFFLSDWQPDLYFNKCTFLGGCYISGGQLNGSVFISNSIFKGDFSFYGAWIDGHFVMCNNVLEGKSILPMHIVKSSIFSNNLFQNYVDTIDAVFEDIALLENNSFLKNTNLPIKGGNIEDIPLPEFQKGVFGSDSL